MITFDTAQELVKQHLAGIEKRSRELSVQRANLSNYEKKVLGIALHEHDHALAVIDDATLHEDFGWIFFYQSKQYLETGNISDQLVGNAPLLVSKLDGKLHCTGTARPIEYYIENFRRHGIPQS